MEFPRVQDVQSADSARSLAIEYSNSTREDYSWTDLAEYQEYFESLADKFPELRDEFEENAII